MVYLAFHGWVSQKNVCTIYGRLFPEENSVGYVTNGVHLPTWTATEWRKVYAANFDDSFMSDQSNEKFGTLYIMFPMKKYGTHVWL